MLDAPSPHHSLTTDEGEHGSTTEPSKGSQLKILSARVHNGFFRSRSPVNPMFEFDPYDKSYAKCFSLVSTHYCIVNLTN